MARARRTKSYVAELSPWVARLNVRRHLSKVSLAQILSGDTCSPISLSDLEAYLAFKEHSIENLQFIVWFQDYRQRFFALSEIEKAYSPGPAEFRSPSSPSRVDVERRAFHNLTQANPCRGRCLIDQTFDPPSWPSAAQGEDDCTILPPLATSFPPLSPPPSSPSTPVTPYTARRVSLVPLLSSSPLNLPPPAITPTNLTYPLTELNRAATTVPHGPDADIRPSSHVGSHHEKRQHRCLHDKQPFRPECMRIIATFFQPGGPKELPLDEIVRDTVVRDLALNTHPDVFLPAYEEVYEMVEQTSVPRFLAFSTANINRPKQLFWYLCGVLHLLGSIAVAIALIIMLPDPPRTNRAWRLFSLPWAWFGSMQIFAASRGFCNQVWNRNGVQLHSWELAEADEESRLYLERVITDAPLEEKTNNDRHKTLHPRSYPRQPHSQSRSQTRSHSSVHSDSTLHAYTASSNYTHGDVYVPPQILDEPLMPYATPTLHDASSTLDSKTISLVAPFLNSSPEHEEDPHHPQHQQPHYPHRDNKSGYHEAQVDNFFMQDTNLIRPPIFGPERVVQDHRIKAVHRQIMNAIWLVGFVYVMAFAAIVLSVPSRNHS